MSATQPSNFKRNFVFGILNGTLVNFGLAFVDPFTVIPVFITHAGGSNVLVGLAAAVYGAGWFLPQVFVARYAETRWRVLNIYRMMSVFRVVAWACVIAVVFTIDHGRTQLFVWLVVLFMFVNTVCAGVAGIPFLEVTSKTIPAERRGTFFGIRRLSGGALGIFAGVIVAIVVGGESTAEWATGWLYNATRWVVDALGWTGHAFPYNYGIVIAAGAVLSSAGLVLFGLLREPKAKVVHPLQPLGEHIRAGFALLRGRPNYRLFFIVRICWQFTSMAFPFYAAYAYSVLGFSEGSVGVFVSVWVGSGVVSNYVWGKLADRKGNRIVLVLTALIALAPPARGLAVSHNGGSANAGGPAGPAGWVFWLMVSTFVINGFSRSGRFISNMMYLLEFAPEERRPLYVGFMNSVSFPFMLSPALGGVIVQAFSFQALFVVSMVFAVVSLVLSAKLVEPRGRPAADQSGYMTE
jgi:MFS family permease